MNAKAQPLMMGIDAEGKIAHAENCFYLRAGLV